MKRPRQVNPIEHKTVYRGHYRVDKYRLRHEKFDGGWSEPLTREVFERGHAAALLPYDPKRDQVVLIEQFRVGAYAAGREPWLVEIVAGLIEDGETAEQVARRECEEECGCFVEALVPIMTVMPSAGAFSETVTLFCGKVDSARGKAHGGAPDEGEDIRVFTLPRQEAIEGLQQQRYLSGTTVLALQWLALHYENLCRAWRGSD